MTKNSVIPACDASLFACVAHVLVGKPTAVRYPRQAESEEFLSFLQALSGELTKDKR